MNDSLNFSQITLFVCGDPFSKPRIRSRTRLDRQRKKVNSGRRRRRVPYRSHSPVCARFEQSAASPPLYHYHTGTSSNRRRLMYARFVSVFEFRIQMAHLPCESGWVTGPTGQRRRRMDSARGRVERERVEVVRVWRSRLHRFRRRYFALVNGATRKRKHVEETEKTNERARGMQREGVVNFEASARSIGGGMFTVTGLRLPVQSRWNTFERIGRRRVIFGIIYLVLDVYVRINNRRRGSLCWEDILLARIGCWKQVEEK